MANEPEKEAALAGGVIVPVRHLRL